MAGLTTPRTQRYLFLVGAFLIFVGTLLPWVCYGEGSARYCADGFSRELFSSGDLSLQNNGAAIVLLLVLIFLWMALKRDGFDEANLQTALAAGGILILVTLYYLSSAWRGLYQQALPTDVGTLGSGLPLLLLGVLLMFAMALLAYLPQRSARRGAAPT
jgi:hypothetical protein